MLTLTLIFQIKGGFIMKKLLLIALAILVLCALVACGEKEEESGTRR